MREDHPILSRLRVPAVAAPMLIVSGPELVVAACRAGVLGSFPTANPREAGELEAWLTRIERELAAAEAAGEAVAPFAPNLIVHRSNVRLEEDLAAIVRHAPAAARVHVPWTDLAGRTWRLHDLLADDTFERDGTEVASDGLFVRLPAWGSHVLTWATV